MISGYSHSFDVGVAQQLGVNAAIVLNHIIYWLRINKKKNENQHDGRTWTYETNKEIADYFGYLSEKQVRTAIDVLEENGLLIKGHYHKNHFNRTNWYAVYDESLIEDKPHLPCRANALDTQDNSDLAHRANVYINNKHKQNNNNVVVAREDAPTEIPKSKQIPQEKIFTKDDLYATSLRSQKDWTSEEIEKGWKIYLNTTVPITSPFDYIEGVINKQRLLKEAKQQQLNKKKENICNTIKKKEIKKDLNTKILSEISNENYSVKDMSEHPLARFTLQGGLKIN